MATAVHKSANRVSQSRSVVEVVWDACFLRTRGEEFEEAVLCQGATDAGHFNSDHRPLSDHDSPTTALGFSLFVLSNIKNTSSCPVLAGLRAFWITPYSLCHGHSGRLRCGFPIYSLKQDATASGSRTKPAHPRMRNPAVSTLRLVRWLAGHGGCSQFGNEWLPALRRQAVGLFKLSIPCIHVFAHEAKFIGDLDTQPERLLECGLSTTSDVDELVEGALKPRSSFVCTILRGLLEDRPFDSMPPQLCLRHLEKQG